MASHSTRSNCGIRVAASPLAATRAAVAEIGAELDGGAGLQHIVVFFGIDHDAATLVQALSEAFPGLPVSGCSTAGEIGPCGMMQGALVAIGFPRDGFRVHSELITDIDRSGVKHATDAARRLKARVSPTKAERRHANDMFALLLVDGLSNAEENIVAAIHWEIDDIELIGGSAGDGACFKRTVIIHNGTIAHRAAVLMIIESDYPFRVFKTQNFEPTGIKLVVTAADTENRIVHELNAEPAAREYAAAIGLLPDDLGPFSFASYPLVVKVGGDYYCRSIRNMNADGSLSFFCAIDEGLVFTVARPRDILSSTEHTLQEVDKALGGIDLVVGFDCILRRLDAETRQIRHQLAELYRKYSVAGFHTYGEQYNAMHLNQTLTGIAFGQRTTEA
ncbi:MAG: FIST C-terminal domain-containing protein [Hyphomicrobium sp.]|nr:FIST C-terminal domain-containing protein [Hyphomicrobium sp.]